MMNSTFLSSTSPLLLFIVLCFRCLLLHTVAVEIIYNASYRSPLFSSSCQKIAGGLVQLVCAYAYWWERPIKLHPLRITPVVLEWASRHLRRMIRRRLSVLTVIPSPRYRHWEASNQDARICIAFFELTCPRRTFSVCVDGQLCQSTLRFCNILRTCRLCDHMFRLHDTFAPACQLSEIILGSFDISSVIITEQTVETNYRRTIILISYYASYIISQLVPFPKGSCSDLLCRVETCSFGWTWAVNILYPEIHLPYLILSRFDFHLFYSKLKNVGIILLLQLYVFAIVGSVCFIFGLL